MGNVQAQCCEQQEAGLEEVVGQPAEVVALLSPGNAHGKLKREFEKRTLPSNKKERTNPQISSSCNSRYVDS